MLSVAFLERLKKEQEHFRELEEKLGDPQLMQDPKALKQIAREHARLESQAKQIDNYLHLFTQWQENEQLIKEERDKELRSLAQEESEDLAKQLEKQKREIELLLISA